MEVRCEPLKLIELCESGAAVSSPAEKNCGSYIFKQRRATEGPNDLRGVLNNGRVRIAERHLESALVYKLRCERIRNWTFGPFVSTAHPCLSASDFRRDR